MEHLERGKLKCRRENVSPNNLLKKVEPDPGNKRVRGHLYWAECPDGFWKGQDRP